jgi:hypothetical protein
MTTKWLERVNSLDAATCRRFSLRQVESTFFGYRKRPLRSRKKRRQVGALQGEASFRPSINLRAEYDAVVVCFCFRAVRVVERLVK